jgi:poly-gamma-glutamate synthesis protein (capsule biosynthesis protein)
MGNLERKQVIGIVLIVVLIFAISIGIGYFNLNYTVTITRKEKDASSATKNHTERFDFNNESIRDHIKIDSSAPSDYKKVAHDDNESLGNEEAGQCKILFAGDTYLAPNIVREYTYGGGLYTILDDIYIDAIDKIDYFVANLETCITDRDTDDVKKEFSLKQSPDDLHVLDSLGVNLFATANNHALDFGHEALADTWQYLDYIGINTFGSGSNKEEARKPFIVTINGVRVAFFNATGVVPKEDWKATETERGVTYLSDPYEYIIPQIRKLKENDQIDKAIVFVHWGKELEEKPSKTQIEQAHNLVIGGADLVVGAHPHIPQTIEYYRGKPIVYSLGNFIFGKNILKQMALVQIEFDLKKDETKLKVIPGTGWWNSTKAYRFEERQFCFDKYIQDSDSDLIFDKDGYVYEKNMLSTPSIAQIEKELR